MVNIIYLIDDLMIGGNTALINVLKYLDRSKYNLKVYCLFGGGAFQENLQRLNIETEILNYRARNIYCLLKLIKLFRNDKIDILHTIAIGSNIIGRAAGIFANVPVIISSEWGLVDSRRLWHRFLDKILSYFTYRIIVVAEAVKSSLILYEKIAPSKITVVYNCIDMDEYRLNPIIDHKLDNTGPVIGLIANFVWEKAHQVFIKAAKLITREYPNAKFLLIGSGEKILREVKKLVETLNLRENVIFMGHRKDIPELLFTFDVSVLSSVSEGAPMALLEAMASAKPVVATAVGGIPEIVVDKITGLLVAPNDAVALANSILAVLSDKNLSERLGKEGRKRIEEMFDARKVVKNIESIYDAALIN